MLYKKGISCQFTFLAKNEEWLKKLWLFGLVEAEGRLC